MSKASKLKQDAYRAGKQQDWDTAISVYKQILELDKTNPTVINELGDIYLKKGSLARAVENFLNAAQKYRQTGLQNNAVAIYKKILRHDAENLNAHWYLAEIRANQGLIVEGEPHALTFLAASDSISSEIKEIHLKRCVQLLPLYQQRADVMGKLADVFEFWDMDLERHRSSCVIARLRHEAGETEEARAMADAAVAAHPEIKNYPEFAAWLESTGQAAAASHCEDVNTVSLEAPAQAQVDGPAVESAGGVATEVAVKEPVAEAAVVDEASFGDISVDLPVAAEESADEPAVETMEEDDGCISIDVDDSQSFAEVVADVSSEVEKTTASEADAEEADADEGGIDLLAELLSEDSELAGASQEDTVDLIAEEIGKQVGGGGETPAELYDMGMVYLEMGLLDQACDAFEMAVADETIALRAYEMWGITLQRSERYDESIAVLDQGLACGLGTERERLGLLYHQGRAHEQAGDNAAARTCYEHVYEASATFLDVKERLRVLYDAG